MFLSENDNLGIRTANYPYNCLEDHQFLKLVPKTGLEPARSCEHCALNAGCLPFHHFGKETRHPLLYEVANPIAKAKSLLVTVPL